ncbi:hypothetical protein [Methyloligella halotolerans]|uniref:hypothetical protein n=1 Tax=Methyloligella halotolerans TaxID=1177755 RepID=UPI00114D33E1|nr:hypothetical protein [Methyloligella halotolerans]
MLIFRAISRVQFMITFYWPCEVISRPSGRFLVRPYGVGSCDGEGETLREAQDMAQEKLQDRLDNGDDEVLIAMVTTDVIDPADVVSGQRVRIPVRMPKLCRPKKPASGEEAG